MGLIQLKVNPIPIKTMILDNKSENGKSENLESDFDLSTNKKVKNQKFKRDRVYKFILRGFRK